MEGAGTGRDLKETTRRLLRSAQVAEENVKMNQGRGMGMEGVVGQAQLSKGL